MIENFARRREGFDEDRLLGGYALRHVMQVVDGQREEFAKGSGVLHDAQDRARRAVPAEAAHTPCAVSAGKIDFARHAAP